MLELARPSGNVTNFEEVIEKYLKYDDHPPIRFGRPKEIWVLIHHHLNPTP